jgi:carbamoyl-phosphate synthase large subunit
VSKATGVPLAKAAARIMMGATLDELRKEGLMHPPASGHVAVKEAVLPFTRFPGADAVLGPEMRSTGEVMGLSSTFGLAFAKSQAAAGMTLPEAGTLFLSVNDHDKPGALAVARRFVQMGFELAATEGTAAYLAMRGLRAQLVAKVGETGESGPPGAAGTRQTAVDLIHGGAVQLVLNTPSGRGARTDGAYIRAATLEAGIPCITTLAGAWAAAVGIGASLRGSEAPQSLQEWHRSPSQMRL